MGKNEHVKLLAVAVAAAALVLGGVGAARAEDPSPVPATPTADDVQNLPQSQHDTGAGAAAGEEVGVPDTGGPRVAEPFFGNGADVPANTPYAKDGSELFKQIGGALFPQSEDADPTKLVTGSPTRYSDNLYDVAFADSQLGIAAGSDCEDSNPDAEKACKPTAYIYIDTPEHGKGWDPVSLPHSTEPGYVGAIAWMGPTTAMLVGGTGTYPRREPAAGKKIDGTDCAAPPAGKPYLWSCDQAGEARAWLYDDGSWCELGRDGDCPDLPKGRDGEAPHGLTAVDFRSSGGADEGLLGFVGGLGQIWQWQDDGFTKLFDNQAPQNDLDQTPVSGQHGEPDLFNYRVRDIKFSPVPGIRAFAVTDGCCSAKPADPAKGEAPTSPQGPSVLLYTDGASDLNGTTTSKRPPLWLLYDSGAGRPDPAPKGTDQSGFVQHPELDSFYGLGTAKPTNSASYNSAPAMLLSSAGGPSGPGEPRSIIQCTGTSGSPAPPPSQRQINGASAPEVSLSTARLLAIDGVADPEAQNPCIPDRAVGELRSQKATGHGRRGLVVLTRTAARSPAPDHLPPFPTSYLALFNDLSTDGGAGPDLTVGRLDAYSGEISKEALAKGPNYRPTDEQQIRDSLESFDFLTTSYALNALEMVGDSGSGWAVGDHGALVRFGDSGSDSETGKSAEPAAPRLGERKPKPLIANPYDSAPQGEQPGDVPSLAGQPRQKLDQPRLVNTGIPDATFTPNGPGLAEDVAQIVMSRDGNEGWAVGANPDSRFSDGGSTDNDGGMPSFYHYDGSAWKRCDPVGIRGQLPPDPSCNGLAGLRRYATESGLENVKIHDAARVPLEKDSDPANDDDFEIVAIGTPYRDPKTQPDNDDPVILRYRGGEWDFEPLAARRAIHSQVLAAGQSGGAMTNPAALRLKDVAFLTPDDGWILGRHNTSAGDINELYHYDGTSWNRCRLSGPEAYHPDEPGLVDCGANAIPALESHTGVFTGQMRMVSAGDRVYVYGGRDVGGVSVPGGLSGASGLLQGTPRAPFILFHERGKPGWTDGADAGESGGGYDPGRRNPNHPGVLGQIASLAISQGPNGRYEGWVVGRFYDSELPGTDQPGQIRDPAAILMRLEEHDGRSEWKRFRSPGAFEDLMWPSPIGAHGPYSEPHLATITRGANGKGQALIAQNATGRLFAFNDRRQRWELAPSGRRPAFGGPGGGTTWEGAWEAGSDGWYQAVVADNQGGAWLAVKNLQEAGAGSSQTWACCGQVFFYHYTASPPEDLFTDTPQPFGERSVKLTSLAGAPTGDLWASTDSSLIAHYTRIGGWETARIPGWDAGRVVTATSEINAIAAGADGSAVAVGKRGRIADLSPTGIGLDAAAGGKICAAGALGLGCGTSRDLRAVSIAPEDGSALAGGDTMATLWRPPGGAFQRIASPPGGSGSNITGISMPSATTAWITNDKGFVLGGEMKAPGIWEWKIENRIDSGPNKGTILGSVSRDLNLPLRSVAIDRNGHGYAVGASGLVLERSSDGSWRRLRGPGTDHLTSVTLAAGASGGALIGGRDGAVWTADGDNIQIARPGDYFHQGGQDYEFPALHQTGPIVGVALLPGVQDGQSEAWVGIAPNGPGTNRLLHYASDPSEPLLEPNRKATALSDVPPRREGEIAFGAYGKSDCLSILCMPMAGTTNSDEIALGRITGELSSQVPSSKADFALFTGDVTENTGETGTAATPIEKVGDPTLLAFGLDAQPRGWGARHAKRFSELFADPLRDAGVPLFGTLGPGDLSRPLYNFYTDDNAVGQAKAGDNLPWRKGFADRSAPWGGGGEAKSGTGLSFVPAGGTDAQAQPFPDQSVDPDQSAAQGLETGCQSSKAAGPDAEALACATKGDITQPTELKGGARTHYATDAIRDGKALARIITIDSSFRDLAAADPAQQPTEKRGNGQLDWLESMLCFEDQKTPTGESCTRSKDEQAIVLTNTPTYSYGPSDPSATEIDGTVLESLYFKYRVNAVVSGRLGWNGLYYAVAPGLHTPCAGDGYPAHPPAASAKLCESTTNQLPVADPTGQANDALKAIKGDPTVTSTCKTESAPVLCDDTAGLGGGWVVPFVIASGAGGKFGPGGRDTGTASQGYWHGYTKVRLSPDGDPRKMLVEQRPILDWIELQGDKHVVRPNQKVKLSATGREPLAFSMASGVLTTATRYDDIASPAVTHCYDLLLADPHKPWLPIKAADASDEQLAGAQLGGCRARSFDSGFAPARNGNASNPCDPYLCLDPTIAKIDDQSGQIDAGAGDQPRTFAIAMLSVAGKAATWPLVFEPRPSFTNERPPPPPLPVPAPTPGVSPAPPTPPPSVSIPTPPPPPALPLGAPLSATLPPPAPLPPSSSTPILNVFAQPTSISVAPSVALFPPAPPVINVAPPTAARPRQEARKAAVQSSGSENDSPTAEGTGHVADETKGSAGDLGMSRHESPRSSPNEATRRDRVAPGQSITPLARHAQPSAWARDLQWGGGLTLMALVFAFGWITVRPTPKRREPEVPSPAWARHRSRD